MVVVYYLVLDGFLLLGTLGAVVAVEELSKQQQVREVHEQAGSIPHRVLPGPPPAPRAIGTTMVVSGGIAVVVVVVVGGGVSVCLLET